MILCYSLMQSLSLDSEVFCKNSLLTLYYLNSEKDWETWRKPIVLVEDFNKDLLEGPIPPRCASPVPGKSTFFLMLEK